MCSRGENNSELHERNISISMLILAGGERIYEIKIKINKILSFEDKIFFNSEKTGVD